MRTRCSSTTQSGPNVRSARHRCRWMRVCVWCSSCVRRPGAVTCAHLPPTATAHASGQDVRFHEQTIQTHVCVCVDGFVYVCSGALGPGRYNPDAALLLTTYSLTHSAAALCPPTFTHLNSCVHLGPVRSSQCPSPSCLGGRVSCLPGWGQVGGRMGPTRVCVTSGVCVCVCVGVYNVARARDRLEGERGCHSVPATPRDTHQLVSQPIPRKGTLHGLDGLC